MLRMVQKEYYKAIPDLNEAIRLDPTIAENYYTRGMIWRELREYDKAIADLDQSIRLNPENPDAYSSRGETQAFKKEFDKAIVDFDHAIRLDPTNAWNYYSRGVANAWLKQYEQAIGDLDQAIEREPNNPKFLNVQAWFRATCPIAKCRDGARAVAAATKACEVTGHKVPALLSTLAAAYAQTGDFDSAVKWQAKAIELATDAKVKDEYDTRLKLYQAKKPCRATQP